VQFMSVIHVLFPVKPPLSAMCHLLDSALLAPFSPPYTWMSRFLIVFWSCELNFLRNRREFVSLQFFQVSCYCFVIVVSVRR
jgi:hypothetical protein